MGVDRSDLHALLDPVPEADPPVTRKPLRPLVTDWEVAPAESEGPFTDQARLDVEAAETYFDRGGKGVPHKEILKEFDIA